jgi:hypothetical protein
MELTPRTRGLPKSLRHAEPVAKAIQAWKQSPAIYTHAVQFVKDRQLGTSRKIPLQKFYEIEGALVKL